MPSSEPGTYPAATASVWPKENLGVGHLRAPFLDVEVLQESSFRWKLILSFNAEPCTDWLAFIKLTLGVTFFF